MKNLSIFSMSLLVLTASLPLSAQAADDITALVDNGKFFGEMRYRYENVQQDNALNDASAHTIRTNLGYETGSYKGLKILAEAQFVQHLGDEDFNDLDNGQTTFSTVADPDTAQINRAWVSYSNLPDTVVKVGRQALNFDNQRFIGTVGWRQNDQTFDAASISNTSIDGVKLQYTYLDNVNRIFEGSTPADDLESASHLVQASYDHADWLKIATYGYMMDFDNAPALSNQTYGVRVTGKAPINETWIFGYEAEYARQDDYGDNTSSYDADYYHVAPSISGMGLTLKADYEVLEGNGTNAFQTPLATLHKFNGWADTFLNTPASGLKDIYVGLSYKVSNTNSIADGMKLGATYHDFSGDESGDYGSELDLSLAKTFTLPDAGQPFKKVSATLKYADYNAEDAPYVDTEKLWLQLGFKF